MKKIFYSFVLFFSLTKPCDAQVLEQDSLAVYDLYNTNYGGVSSGPISTWQGVTVTGNRVTGIDLPYPPLWSPIFVTSSIGDLTALKKLWINGSGINGGFSGFPASITNCIALEDVSIRSCQLGLPNQSPLFSVQSIKKLSISVTSGMYMIPDSIGKLVNLESLSLTSNRLEGGIPSSLLNCTKLEYLNLTSNFLSGIIPQGIGRLTKLKYLDLTLQDEYGFSGSIPDSIGYCTELRVLKLSGGNNFLTGQIPASITNCRNLSTLVLYGDFYGVNPILQNIGLFTNLDTLQMNQSVSQTPHRIPDAIGRLSRLTNLTLGGLGFSGSTITDSITNCSNLKTIDLHGCNFTGMIPEHIGNLTNLSGLYLHSNSLTVPVPLSIFNLNPSLSFNLSSNKFTFDGLQQLKQYFTYLVTSPQPNISIRYYNNRLSVSAGGTLANNTYKWYRNGSLYSTVTGDSTLATTVKGTYYVEVTNSVVTGLTLTSSSIYVPLKLCPPAASASLTSSSVSGSSFQWQMNDGTGYVNISDNANFSGTATPFLELINIPSSWTGYLFRCFVSNSFYSSAEPIKFETLWTGASSNNWEDAASWNCSAVPDSGTDVVITSGTVVVNSNTTIRSLSLAPGASLTVSPGVTLTVLH